MEHTFAVTQLVLICSLGLNGFWLGDRLVSWCRIQRNSLRMMSLGLLALGAVLFYLLVFASLNSELHVFVFAVSLVNNAVLIKCFNEWVRTLPRP